MKIWRYLLLLIFVLLILTAVVFYNNFRGPGGSMQKEKFIIGQYVLFEDKIIDDLVTKGFIKNKIVFNLILDIFGWHGKITPGAYFISKKINAYQLAWVLSRGPDQKWIMIPPGKRKEQAALILRDSLSWSDAKVADFIKIAPEGKLYPDTYLISVQTSADEVVRIMLTNLDDKFDAQLQKELLTQNIRNDTALKIASLIERESGGSEDKPIIAAIIWNRLLKGMRLEIDATVQYALASQTCHLSEPTPLLDNCNFWPHLDSGQVRRVKSPYNTYLNKGLPPTSIASPSLASLRAVAFPAQTEALYYLHSADKEIHIARTYEEHLQNIEIYLK